MLVFFDESLSEEWDEILSGFLGAKGDGYGFDLLHGGFSKLFLLEFLREKVDWMEEELLLGFLV